MQIFCVLGRMGIDLHGKIVRLKGVEMKNETLIEQTARYYTESKELSEMYADMRFFKLEELALEQMAYWKSELRRHVFGKEV